MLFRSQSHSGLHQRARHLAVGGGGSARRDGGRGAIQAKRDREPVALGLVLRHVHCHAGHFRHHPLPDGGRVDVTQNAIGEGAGAAQLDSGPVYLRLLNRTNRSTQGRGNELR